MYYVIWYVKLICSTINITLNIIIDDDDDQKVEKVAFIIFLCIFRWSVMCKLKYSHVFEGKKLYQSENQDQNHEAFLEFCISNVFLPLRDSIFVCFLSFYFYQFYSSLAALHQGDNYKHVFKAKIKIFIEKNHRYKV